MPEFLKIENVPGWVKNTSNKAVLNSDLNALAQYKITKQKNIELNNLKSNVDSLSSDISGIKSEISELKGLLLDFMKNSNNK